MLHECAADAASAKSDFSNLYHYKGGFKNNRLHGDDASATVANRTHSCLPVQPDQPDACPYAKKPHFDPSVASSHSAVLLMLAPVQPAYLRKLYKGCRPTSRVLYALLWLPLQHPLPQPMLRHNVAARRLLRLAAQGPDGRI